MSRYNITLPEFYMDKDTDEFFMKIIRSVKPTGSRIQTKLVLSELYETHYGIFNHLEDAALKPLASVARFEIEDTLDGSPYSSLMRTYISKNIREIFGMDFKEFIDLPKDILTLMVDIADEEMERKSALMNNLKEEMKTGRA